MCFKYLYWYLNFKTVIKIYSYFFVPYFNNAAKICQSLTRIKENILAINAAEISPCRFRCCSLQSKQWAS